MPTFRTPEDIANKALSVLRQPAIYSFNDNTVQSIESARIYDSCRIAELRRACWRFSTRRVILRPIDNTTFYLSPPTWDGTTTFKVGDIVSYQNQFWVCLVANSAQSPGVVPANGNLFWDTYFGPVTVDLYDGPIIPPDSQTPGTTNATSYMLGEMVYMTPNNGSYTIYRSLIQNNANNPTQVDQWLDDTVYSTGQVVSYNSVNYQSLIALNINNEPDISPSQWTATITNPTVSNSWEAMTTSTLAPLNIIWPLDTGPSCNLQTRNVFRLPNGFLRQAPTDPKAGINPWLGGPSNMISTDFVFEGDWIISQSFYPIMIRYVADVQSVPFYDALFSVALAQRLALELAPRLADGEFLATIISDAREEYARTISEARAVNGIETGPVMPFLDDFISCRF